VASRVNKTLKFSYSKCLDFFFLFSYYVRSRDFYPYLLREAYVATRVFDRLFFQTWRNNMSSQDKAIISDASDEDFTKIVFKPDLTKFGMTRLDDDIIDLMSRRAFDIAGTTKGVKVFLNGKKLPVRILLVVSVSLFETACFVGCEDIRYKINVMRGVTCRFRDSSSTWSCTRRMSKMIAERR